MDEKAAPALHPIDTDQGHETHDGEDGSLEALGYKPELYRNRSLFTLLFQSLAIAAIPFGYGAPLISAIYGGGQLSMWLGWLISNLLTQATALSLAELASKYPTSAGPSYWAFQAAPRGKTLAAYITGWVYLIGNWTITLSVNFGFATLLSGTIAMYHPDFILNSWQVVLVFYVICLSTFIICAFFNRYLPYVDTFCAGWTLISIFIIMIALAVKASAGRHSASYSLSYYDTSLSGWEGFTFFIGLLPAAYCFSAVGMISSMAEEVKDPSIKVPRALAYSIPVGCAAGFFFVIPICVTLPPLTDIINAPGGQALPYIFATVIGTPGGGLALMTLVLVITVFCSISITVAASRATWAFARDNAIPGASLWAKVDKRFNVPIYALALVTAIQMALGLVNIGSSSAFTAFVSVGVQALALSYAMPIAISLFAGRKGVDHARWTMGPKIGRIVNVIALLWVAFELVLFSMPTVLPVTAVSMNYASVLLVGFGALSTVWYAIHARKAYKGPPSSDGL